MQFELVGNGYTRQNLTVAGVGLTAPSGGSMSNTAVISFGPCVTANWLLATHMGTVWDSGSGFELIDYGPLLDPTTGLPAPIQINVGQTLRFQIGTVIITEA